MLRLVATLRRRLGDSVTAFRDVFRNPNLRRIELAWAWAILGHWAYLVAVAVYAYDAGGARAVGLLVVIRTVPAALVAPFTASLADRYPRRTVMVASSLVRAALIAAAGVNVLVDGRPEVVYAIAGLAMLVGTPFRPALAAITPSLARSPGELTAANAVVSTLESLGRFVGPALAGVVLAAANTEVVFFCTAASFVVSAAFLTRLDVPGATQRRDEERPAHFFVEALSGFRTVAHDPRLRILLTLFSAQTLIAGANSVLIVVMALDLLDLGESGVGFLNSAFGVGALIGSFAALSLAGMARLTPAFVFGVLLWGAPLIVIGLVANSTLALVLLAVVGIGNSLIDVAFFTLIQRSVPDDVLARVFGVIQMLWILTFGLGGLLVVPLIEGVGPSGALVVAGAFLPVLVVLLGPRLVRLEAITQAPDVELEVLRSVPVFAPLSGAASEQLARQLVPLRLDDGTVVIRQGDPGDRFYIVREGTLEVVVDGQFVSTLGPGESFGEIALIRDVPRTATVTAQGAVLLYALDRDDFLAAVTGHAPSAAEAERVVSARLGSVTAAGDSLSA
jgi:MFS family permease